MTDEPVLVEFELPRPAVGYQATAGTPQHAAAMLDESIAIISAISRRLAKAVAEMDVQRPDQVELDFGVKLAAEGKVVVAKASAEAHFTVKLTWKSRHAPANE